MFFRWIEDIIREYIIPQAEVLIEAIREVVSIPFPVQIGVVLLLLGEGKYRRIGALILIIWWKWGVF